MPRTTVQTPFRWENDEWRDAFMRVDDSNREALARAGGGAPPPSGRGQGGPITRGMKKLNPAYIDRVNR